MSKFGILAFVTASLLLVPGCLARGEKDVHIKKKSAHQVATQMPNLFYYSGDKIAQCIQKQGHCCKMICYSKRCKCHCFKVQSESLCFKRS